VLLSWKSAIYEINTSKVILVYLFWLLILDIAFILSFFNHLLYLY
jgi:hypothetical protein